MQVFSATFNQMLVLFIFMALGYFLNLKKILPSNTSISLSRLETNVLVPCLVFNTFYKYCTLENISQKWTYIVYGIILTVVSVIIGFCFQNYLQRKITSKRYIHILLQLQILVLWVMLSYLAFSAKRFYLII